VVPVDIAFIVLTLLIAIRAAMDGFVKEIGRRAALILGIILGGLFFDEGGVYLRGKIEAVRNVKYAAEVLAFVIIFFIVFVIIHFVLGILKDIINRIEALKALDHLLGFIFGIVESIALIIIILIVINIQPLFDKNIVISGSVFARFLLPHAENFRRAVESIAMGHCMPPKILFDMARIKNLLG
jgi:membrane protein required for colicin V production